MRYDEFLQRYKAAQHEWRLGALDARAALAALRGVVPEIDDARLQQTALFLIERWEAQTSPAAEERMARAQQLAAEAERDEGDARERIARLEQGMRAITAVSRETDDEFEQNAVLALNGPLARLAESWRADVGD
ncbi:hypothetical protein [Kribbella sp. HUAS MG21]|uniref:Uncharacterized protein n=1 Tax=Kribbella sp. HUAS MG21 TaxID=3160966 RepID=A0AAU7TLF3_9ACTN